MKKADCVEHLHGTFYKVPFAFILTPDKNEDANDYSFSNPRMLTQSGVDALTDKKISSDLREDIKKRTLLTALICRWVDHEGVLRPQLVGGDRRYRALDYLIKRKEEVVDPRTQGSSKTSADVAYEHIVCQVFSCETDLDAAVLSWAENKNRVDLTEGHEVAAVIELRKFNVPDDRIMEVLQKDSKWLKETDDLVESLDQESLSLLCEDKLKRGAAIHVSKIDVEKRPAVLKSALDRSEKLYGQKLDSLDKKLDSIHKKKDRAETKKVIAQESGDEKLLERSQKVLDRSNEREKEVEDQRSKAKPIASKKMIEVACKEIGVDIDDTKKAGKKTIRNVMTQIQEIIDKDGEVSFLSGDNIYLDVTFLELVKMVLEKHALNDSMDLAETLSEWKAMFVDDSDSSVAVGEEEGSATKEDVVVFDEDDNEDNEDDEEDEDEDDDGEDEDDDDGEYTEEAHAEDCDFYSEQDDSED
jgi:hypothetical protein